MAVRRLEALVDAVCDLFGGMYPGSEAYNLRNPLLVKSWARAGKHEIDEQGRRVFSSFLNGYKAGLYDIELKARGTSRANVSPDSPLSDLLLCYQIENRASQQKVVSFLKRALNDESISINTPVSFFVESN
jgi:hypothetical protein